MDGRYLRASSGVARLIVASIFSLLRDSVVCSRRYLSLSVCFAGEVTFPPTVISGILRSGLPESVFSSGSSWRASLIGADDSCLTGSFTGRSRSSAATAGGDAQEARQKE